MRTFLSDIFFCAETQTLNEVTPNLSLLDSEIVGIVVIAYVVVVVVVTVIHQKCSSTVLIGLVVKYCTYTIMEFLVHALRAS